MDEFDFVIVGGGTAGCVLAARLSENPDVQVLLLEAGAAVGPSIMDDPSSWGKLKGTSVDWDDYTTFQPGTGAQHSWSHGKVLGGSSSINAMMHIRGHRSSYDVWEEAGAVGWNYDELLPFFKRSEHAPGRDPAYRGMHGPMTVAADQDPDPLWDAVYEAATTLGYPAVGDLNDGNDYGVSWGERNVVQGKRQSAAAAYLEPALDRPNLVTLTEAHVYQLVLQGSRCRRVRIKHHGELREIGVRAETILAAGAIGSPHLLLLSGIGPAAQLRALGIEVHEDLACVGANLHDHGLSAIGYAAARPRKVSTYARRPTIRVRGEAGLSDLQIFPVAAVIHPRWSTGSENGFSMAFSAMAPLSRGSLRLESADPAARPIIDPAYLSDERDLASLVHGLRIARRLLQSSELDEYRGEELLPGAHVESDHDCQEYIRRSLASFYHPVGTCKLGPASDPAAVVDLQLRVHGVDNLRVVDASVIPSIPSANTNATVLAIAERAVSWIGQGRG
jgi:choline dehydrogenase